MPAGKQSRYRLKRVIQKINPRKQGNDSKHDGHTPVFFLHRPTLLNFLQASDIQVHLHAAAAGCSACEYATAPGNIHGEALAVHAPRARVQQACSYAPAMQRQRPLYRRRLCPDLLLRKRRYSTLTSTLPVKKHVSGEYTLSSRLSASYGEGVCGAAGAAKRLSGRHSLPGFCARADRRPLLLRLPSCLPSFSTL